MLANFYMKLFKKEITVTKLLIKLLILWKKI